MYVALFLFKIKLISLSKSKQRKTPTTMPATRKTNKRKQLKRGGSFAATLLGSLDKRARKRATYKPKPKYKGRSWAKKDNHWPFPEIEKYFPGSKLRPPTKKPAIPPHFLGSYYKPATENQPASGTMDIKWPRRPRVTTKPYIPRAKAGTFDFKKRGGFVGLAKTALSLGVPEIYKMVHAGVGSQGGNSAGSRASRMRFGIPLTKRYR